MYDLRKYSSERQVSGENNKILHGLVSNLLLKTISEKKKKSKKILTQTCIVERKFGRNLASISPFEVTRTITCNTLPPSWGSSLRASPKKETGVEDCFLRRSCEGKKLLIITPLYRYKITERNEAGVSPTPCGYICHHRAY